MSHAEDFLEIIEHNPDFVDSIIITGNDSCGFANASLTKGQNAACVSTKSRAKKLYFQKLKIPVISWFSRMTISKLKPQPTADVGGIGFSLEVHLH